MTIRSYLRDAEVSLEFAGQAAVVTGAAGGIGLATAEAIMTRGGCVLGLDRSDSVLNASGNSNWYGMQCDVTNSEGVHKAILEYATRVGKIEKFVSNAGIFTAGPHIADLSLETWNQSLQVNLTSHLIVLKEVLKYMPSDGTGSIVIVGSRNVQAPGPGAAAYSVAKAGLTQLARVAAIELGQQNIRVNVVHPDAVFNTALWTQEALQSSADRYGLTIEQYKKNNILNAEIGVENVSEAICALLSDRFARTTGAQVPVDGGNIRVI